VCVDRWWKYTY